MGRWEPDARGRMAQAALELFAEQGFEQTTAAGIAERAGVTERTFFRYFADKREVLFDGSQALEDAVVGGVAAAPADASPLEAAAAGFVAAAELLGTRDRSFVRRRTQVVAAHPGLQERELLKMARLSTVVAEALRERGVPDSAARLAADSGVTVFRAGFARWIGEPDAPGLVDCVRQALEELRGLVG